MKLCTFLPWRPQCAFVACCLLLKLVAVAAPAISFIPGEMVRLTRSETLLFKGANFLGAPKGQEFSVLQQDTSRSTVFVSFYKNDGTVIALTLPLDALESSPADGWRDLLRGVEAFRDGRYEESRKLLYRAAQDPKQKQRATALAARLTGAVAASQGAPAAALPALQGLRDVAAQLCAEGSLSLGQAVDLGTDRLGARLGAASPPTKLAREEIAKKVAISTRAVATSRQAMALHRLKEAARLAQEGEEAEPGRPELVAQQERIKKELADADDRYKDANRMRKIPKGEVHALTALERGLKICVDHPGLLSLRQEMQGALESRTAPQLTSAMLNTAKAGKPAEELEEGRKLYTARCTECHDLELIDSRTGTGWERIVASMARRAGVNATQQARINAYLAVASQAVGNE